MAQIFEANLPKYQEYAGIRERLDNIAHLPEAQRLKMFYCDFVQLQGLFFAWSVRMHLEYIRNSSLSQPTSTQSSTESTTLLSKLNDTIASKLLRSDRELKATKLQQLTAQWLEDFDWIISEDKLRGGGASRFVTVCLFAIHFADMPDASLLSNGDGSFSQFLHATYDSQVTTDAAATPTAADGARKVDRTIIQSQALSMLFGMVTRSALRLIQATPGSSSGAPAAHWNIRPLTLILLFLLWLERHPEHLLAAEEVEVEDVALPSVFNDSLSMDESNSVQQQAWKRKFCVNKEQGRYEQRIRSNLRSAMAQLRSALLQVFPDVQAARPPRQTSDTTLFALRDLVELRGFLPLGESTAELFANFHPLKQRLEFFGAEVSKLEAMRLIFLSIGRIFDLPVTQPELDSTKNGNVPRTRQLFDPNADSKAKAPAKKPNEAKKDAKTQPAMKKGSSAQTSSGHDGVEKKRAKLHEKQGRDASKVAASLSEPSLKESFPASLEESTQVTEAVKGATWELNLEEPDTAAIAAEDNTFEQLNQSIASEIAAEERSLSAVPSLTELIRQQAENPSVSSVSPFGFPTSRSSISANPSQDRLSAYLSPAVSFGRLPDTGIDSELSQRTSAQMAATAEDDEDDFEDVVFRPAFPKDNSVLNSLESHPQRSKANDIWAQFGINSSSAVGDASTLSSQSTFASLPALTGSAITGLPSTDVKGIHGLGSGWESDIIFGNPTGPAGVNTSGTLSSGDYPSFERSDGDIFASLGVGQSHWDDSAVSMMLGTGLSASSAVLDSDIRFSAGGAPPGLFSSGNSQSIAGAPPGLHAASGSTSSAPPGLSSQTSSQKSRRGEDFLAYLAQQGQGST